MYLCMFLCSVVSRMAPWMSVLVTDFTSLGRTEVCQNLLDGLLLDLCTNMTCSQMIHPNYFFSKANIRLKIQVLSKMSQRVFDGELFIQYLHQVNLSTTLVRDQ